MNQSSLINFVFSLIIISFLISENSAQRFSPFRKKEESSNQQQQQARQYHTDDPEKLGREIKAKRTNYGGNGVILKQFPLTIAISNPNEGAVDDRPKLTQEQRIRLNAPQLIEANGYRVETHDVETEDGHILTLFRVINPNCTVDPFKAPILFQHGVLDSADTWLVLDGDSGAPYQAANYQYDVWLGNARGNHYSRKHQFLSRKDPAYWNFSWHEMGIYDLPAVFKYILKITASWNTRQKINYVGHSMGTTMFYVCLSTFPEYNDVIDTMIALPPSAFLSSITSPLMYLKPYAQLYKLLINGPFLPSEINHLVSNVAIPLCPIPISIGNIRNESICNFLVYIGQGQSKEDTNSTVLQRVFGHFPSTTSKKLIAHFLQMVGEERFTQFDYGEVKNFKVYNQTFPPSYNLFNMDVRTLNFYGELDILIDYKDSEQNIADTGSSKNKFGTLIMAYSHLDFLWGNSAGPALVSRFLTGLENFYENLYGENQRVSRKQNSTQRQNDRAPKNKEKEQEETEDGSDCNCKCTDGVCFQDEDHDYTETETESKFHSFDYI